MPDVFPRRNLPGDAEQWGRAHDDRVLSLEESLERVSQSIQGQNRNSASSLQTLGDQVSDLTGRESYSVFDPSLTFRLPDSLTATPWGPILSFTLAQPRIVSVMFTVGTSYQAAGSASLAYTRGALFIDGIQYAGASRTESGVSGNATVLQGGYSTLNCRAVLPLPAGKHTLQGGYRDTQVIGTSGPSFSFMDLSSPSVFADILQPA